MEKPFLYLITKLIAVILAVTIFIQEDADITLNVISALSFACVFVLELLLEYIKKCHSVIRITIAGSIVACFLLGIETYFLLYIILLVHLVEETVEAGMFYYILGTVFLLTCLIFAPAPLLLMISSVFVAFLLFCRFLITKLTIYKDKYEAEKEQVLTLDQKLNDMKNLTKTIKYKVSVEERNRIAARIHDQVGHGISGSILMLEASLMVLNIDPEKAATGIQKAIVNLREGVDEIRTALKDERTPHYRIGKNEITAMLEEFEVNYNKSAVFKTSGDLDIIPLEIWSCIHDNTKECLTNMLKHSNGTEFILGIEVYQKIIKVEYKDNGSSSETFEKGIGLEAIEERTVNTNGRCFFHKGETGFCVTNIFIY